MGYNPFAVVPADPALAATHTAESARMPSLRARTPYPPAAQLFFRLVVSIHDSTLAMKLALVGVRPADDPRARGGGSRRPGDPSGWRSPMRGTRWSCSRSRTAATSTRSARCGSRRRRTGCSDAGRSLATIAFVLAVATKLLPIVLVPLLIGRVRLQGRGDRCRAARRALLSLSRPGRPAVRRRAQRRRVHPVQRTGVPRAGRGSRAARRGCRGAARRRDRRCHRALAAPRPSDPAAWAWPMAMALACAPVIYPWYLLYLTPFLWTRATLPLLAWCLSGLAAYVVWEICAPWRPLDRAPRDPGLRARRATPRVPDRVCQTSAAGDDRRGRGALTALRARGRCRFSRPSSRLACP